MNSKKLIQIWFAVLVLMVLSSCLPKADEKKEESSEVPSEGSPGGGGGSGGTTPTLQSSYCSAHFIRLTTDGGQYKLYVPDLGNTAIPMTGSFENGFLNLTGQASGMDLMYIAALFGNGAYMSTNLLAIKDGVASHSIKSLAKAGDCGIADPENLPKLAVNPVDLGQIAAISRFRSSSGHNFSDIAETCRSMKHYYQPKVQTDQTTKIYAPFRAIVIAVYNDDGPINDDEVRNQHITLQPVDHPGIIVEIFHTELAAPLVIGTVVEAGTHLAWSYLTRPSGIGSDFDFSVHVNTAEGVRNASIMDLFTDEAFAEYTAWSGLASREDFKISKELRDANPLQCANDSVSPLSGNFIDSDSDPLLNLRFVVEQ